MGPLGHQRIAQRFPVATTPIEWKVPKRRGATPRSKTVWAEAAVIELSVMGAAVVAPIRWRALKGSKVEARWEGHEGVLIIRREVPFPGSESMALYGCEYADNASPLATELFERLVVQAAMAATAREAALRGAAAAEPADVPGPGVWRAPAAWSPGTR
jgi:hypothetical protein